MNDIEVLVVSSDEKALSRYRTILRGSGCEVTEARSIKEAFAHLDEPYEVVFTDYDLADGNAVKLATHIAVLAPEIKNVVCFTESFRIEAKHFKKLIDRSSEDRYLIEDIRTALGLCSPTYVGRSFNRRRH